MDSARSSREGWLDAVRAVALARVILWHAFGAAAITYVLSAVPAMFFVTGSLLAKSLDRRPARAVLVDRARRLLVPLAAFSGTAVAVMAIAWVVAPSATTELPWRGLVTWFLPLADPSGSDWEGGYLSSPLWYLRALLWLLLLSPLLLRATRWQPAVALGVPVAAVMALDWVGRHPGWVVPGLPDLVWQAGDVALYAVFLVLGFAHRDGLLDRIGTAAWLAVAGASGLAVAAWMLTQPVPGLVINNSHPAHLLAGLAWLAVLLASRGALEALTATRVAGRAVVWVIQRTMTIYLWHAAALIVTRLALGRVGPLPVGVWSMAFLAGTAAVMTLLILTFGWVEDLAAGRPARLWPGLARHGSLPLRPVAAPPERRARPALGVPAAAGLAVLVMASSVIGGAPAGAVGPRPPVPSQAPPRPTFRTAAAGFAVADDHGPRSALFARVGGGIVWAPEELAPAVPTALAGALQREVEAWGDAHGVPGAQVGLLRPHAASWTGAFGVDPFAGTTLTTGTRFDVTSTTKSFTAALVFQLAEERLVDLDSGLPALAAAPDLDDHAAMTPRQLLAHRSGLVGYRDTKEFAENPHGVDSAEAAVAAAARAARTMAPGLRAEYSSTNYLVLGLLVEQVTGRPFDDLLAERLLEPLGLDRTTHSPPAPAAPNAGTAGIVSDVADQLRWGAAAFRDRAVTSHPDFGAMAGIDPASSLGPGTVGMCPCGRTDAGDPYWEWVGYTGSTTAVQYSAARDLVFTIRVTDDLWQAGRFESVLDLAARLDDLMAAAL